jgi:hypothetical protein
VDIHYKKFESEVSRIYDDVINGKNLDKVERVSYRTVDEAEAEKLNRHTGLELDGYKHELSNREIRHILKQHGNEKLEEPRGQTAVTKKDLLLIPEITKNYDSVELSPETSESRQVLLYRKKIGNEYYYYESIGGKHNKKLSPKTMYIVKKKG